jgi:hypothetical protein
MSEKTIEIDRMFVSKGIEEEMAVPIFKSLIATARKESLTIKLQNGEATPFRIIAEPHGVVFFGIGGCGKGG